MGEEGGEVGVASEDGRKEWEVVFNDDFDGVVILGDAVGPDGVDGEAGQFGVFVRFFEDC